MLEVQGTGPLSRNQTCAALHIEASQLGEASVMRPVGCEHCRQTGYKGRIGIFEIFEIDDEVRHMVNNRASTMVVTSAGARARDAHPARRRRAQGARGTDLGRGGHFDDVRRRQLTMKASLFQEVESRSDTRRPAFVLSPLRTVQDRSDMTGAQDERKNLSE